MESNINFGRFWYPTLTLGVFGVQRFSFGRFFLESNALAFPKSQNQS
ncbi:MAG: hypothetical protein KAI83_05450 [Thiomargarita sp.]|nr:hypothetical protein [Thiomargarita sp.]